MERRVATRSSLVIVLVAACLGFVGDGIGVGAETAVTLEPAADATVAATQPGANFGRGTLRVHGKPRRDAYVRFGVPAGATGRAVLRLWVLDPTVDGPKIRRYDGRLNESTITWANRVSPLVGAPVDSGRLEAGTWAEWDVSHLVRPGDLTLAAVADSTDGVEFSSRESDRRPQLVITTVAPPSTGSPSPSTGSPSPSTGSPSTRPPTTSTVRGARSSPACEPNWAAAKPMAELGDGLGEMSAFIASPNHRRWAWGIRDSGKPASLYAIEPEAGVVRTQEFRAYGLRNSDWEDLTYTPGPVPGTGHLWVLENVGNGWTGNRFIYQFEELDPENPPPPPPSPPTTTTTMTAPTTSTSAVSTTSTSLPGRRPRGALRRPRGTLAAAATSAAEPGDSSAPEGEPVTTTTVAPPPPPPPSPPEPDLPPATLLGTYEWAYPDTQVNTESMFVFDGDLVVVTKTEPSRVYRFDSPLRTTALNVPTYVGTLPAGNRLSVAALSADQRTLAVSSHGKLNVFENRGDVSDLSALISNHVFHQAMPADNREGGSFFPYGSCDLLLVAESKTIWRLKHR